MCGCYIAAFCCVPMKFIVWKYQGAASKKFLRAAHSIIRQHRPGLPVFAFYLETNISGFGADEICVKLDFDNSIRVEAVGMSGGIWVLWNESLNASVLRTNPHPHFVLMEVEERSSNLPGGEIGSMSKFFF